MTNYRSYEIFNYVKCYHHGNLSIISRESYGLPMLPSLLRIPSLRGPHVVLLIVAMRICTTYSQKKLSRILSLEQLENNMLDYDKNILVSLTRLYFLFNIFPWCNPSY